MTDSQYEPDVTLTLPVDATDDPVAAVEDFIHQFEGQPHLWSFEVKIGPKRYLVDMDAADGKRVTEVEVKPTMPGPAAGQWRVHFIMDIPDGEGMTARAAAETVVDHLEQGDPALGIYDVISPDGDWTVIEGFDTDPDEV